MKLIYETKREKIEIGNILRYSLTKIDYIVIQSFKKEYKLLSTETLTFYNVNQEDIKDFEIVGRVEVSNEKRKRA